MHPGHHRLDYCGGGFFWQISSSSDDNVARKFRNRIYVAENGAFIDRKQARVAVRDRLRSVKSQAVRMRGLERKLRRALREIGSNAAKNVVHAQLHLKRSAKRRTCARSQNINAKLTIMKKASLRLPVKLATVKRGISSKASAPAIFIPCHVFMP